MGNFLDRVHNFLESLPLPDSVVMGLERWLEGFSVFEFGKTGTELFNDIASDQGAYEHEREEFFNIALKSIWPTLKKNFIQEPDHYAEWINRSLPIGFEAKNVVINLGPTAPHISSIQVQSQENPTKRMEVIVDAEFHYSGECDLKFEIHSQNYDTFHVVVNNVQASMNMRMSFKPPIEMLPIISSVSLSIIDSPRVHFDCVIVEDTDALAAIDIKRVLDNTLIDMIVRTCLHPKEISLNYWPGCAMDDVVMKPPEGIVRLELISGMALEECFPPPEIRRTASVAADSEIQPKLTVFMRVMHGGKSYITKYAVRDEKGYSWNEVFTFEIQNVYDESILVEVYHGNRAVFVTDIDVEEQNIRDSVRDEIDMTEVRMLGHVTLRCTEIGRHEYQDHWHLLNQEQDAKIHIVSHWQTLSRNPEFLANQNDIGNEIAVKASEKYPIGMLLIFFDMVRNLPDSDGVRREFRNFDTIDNAENYKNLPSPKASLGLVPGGVATELVSPGLGYHPKYRHSFSIFIHSITQKIEIKIIDERTAATLGVCYIPIKAISEAPNMQLCGWFRLFGLRENNDAEIYLFIRLRSMRDSSIGELFKDDAAGEGLLTSLENTTNRVCGNSDDCFLDQNYSHSVETLVPIGGLAIGNRVSAIDPRRNCLTYEPAQQHLIMKIKIKNDTLKIFCDSLISTDSDWVGLISDKKKLNLKVRVTQPSEYECEKTLKIKHISSLRQAIYFENYVPITLKDVQDYKLITLNVFFCNDEEELCGAILVGFKDLYEPKLFKGSVPLLNSPGTFDLSELRDFDHAQTIVTRWVKEKDDK